MANKHVNAVIVGAGASGGVVAKELATAGLTVALLERGKWYTYDDVDNDELTSQRMFPLKCGYGPDKNKYRRVLENPDGSTRLVYPNEWAYGNNAACVGGGTLSYGAMGWRFMPQDFIMKSRYGSVENSTLDDWPVSYDELEPYYEKAEYEIGVSGDYRNNPFAGHRTKPFPMPGFSYNDEARILEKAANNLGWHPFPIPMARNSIPYRGRPACYRFRTCVGYACPVNAKGGSQNTVIPIALQTGNCDLRTECKVFEIILDDRGSAKGVKYYDQNDKLQTQTSDIVVVAGSASETARLLLLSKSKMFPNGAGNNNGWIGHNYQDHAYCGANGLFAEDIFSDEGPGACIAISDFNHENDGIIGGGVLCNEFYPLPYQFSTMRPPGSKSWGKEHKDFQRKYFNKYLGVHGPIQEIPVFEKKVELDPEVKDYWGIPSLRVSGLRHEEDIKGCKFLAEKAEQWLKEAGAVETWQSVPGRQSTPGQHQSGTCRMGNDPKTSVTNKYGQLHEIDNIFVADGSLHVTNGGFNPALTIFTMGYWVSDYIKKEWNGTKFKSN